MRRRSFVRPHVAERIKALCDNPPPEAFAKIQCHLVNPKPKRPKLSREEKNRRIKEGKMRAFRKKAIARIDAGLSCEGAGAALRITQRTIENSMQQEWRASDPLEQAKLLIRRSGRVLYSMSIYGGRHDEFYVSGLGKHVPKDRVLELADRLSA